jgi:cytidine deaminase
MDTKLDETLRQKLIESAAAVRKLAYIPYSNFAVGAALLAPDGTIYTGCNVENAAYPATICAERTALVKAVSSGQRQFRAIAVMTEGGGSPCGTCRQVMFEFAPDMLVMLVDAHGKITAECTVRELLPMGFSPADLKR